MSNELKKIGNVRPGSMELKEKTICVKKGKFMVLAKCGKWEAQLAQEVYVFGQVIILAKKCNNKKQKKKEKFPEFLGEREIVDRDKLIELIDVVSQVLLNGLEEKCCKKIYLASLNEGSLGLHFWLIPRYGKDSPKVKKVSGFFLISDYVREYLSRSDDCRRDENCNHHGPFVPFEHDGTRYEYYDQYAVDFWKCFEKGWERVNG